MSIQSHDTATTPTHAIYRNLSMIQDEERRLMFKYARFLSDVPRKIKRIVNVYAVTRNIARESFDLESDPGSLICEKLFILTVLQESFPYRTSWLVFLAICAETKHGVRFWVDLHAWGFVRMERTVDPFVFIRFEIVVL